MQLWIDAFWNHTRAVLVETKRLVSRKSFVDAPLVRLALIVSLHKRKQIIRCWIVFSHDLIKSRGTCEYLWSFSLFYVLLSRYFDFFFLFFLKHN